MGKITSIWTNFLFLQKNVEKQSAGTSKDGVEVCRVLYRPPRIWRPHRKNTQHACPAFPKLFCSGHSFWLRKITTDHVDMVRADDWYPKLKIYISALILDRYWYIPVAYVTMHSMIWPWLKSLMLASWVQGVFKLDILTVIRNGRIVSWRSSAIILKILFL